LTLRRECLATNCSLTERIESRFISAQAVKRLRSRYALVLTGTPIENRIDELHSLMDFLKPGEAKSI